MLQSMNKAGKMNENAHRESFFHSMRTKELYGRTFTDDQQLRQTLCSYIAFHNQQRLHSRCTISRLLPLKGSRSSKTCVK